MSAVRLQTDLKEAFDAPEPPALSVISESAQLPAPAASPARRETDEILVGYGKLSAEAAQRINERVAKTGEGFATAARKLNLATAADLEIARAIRDGVARDEVSVFDLGADLIALRRPNSPAAEQYRSLRTRLATTQAAEKLKGVSIVPAGVNVRAEIAAANVAVAFAQIGKRVLLIDGDLRRPCLGRIFALSRPDGVPQLLSDAGSFDDALRETAVERLSLLAGQAACLQPEEFLASARFSTMLRRARAEFDVVLALTAPFGAAADGQFVWAETKAALVAARRDHTRADELKNLQTALRQVGAEILGAVVLA